MWVGILALGIGLHAHAATQLPLSDAFAYYFKAYNFWTAEAKSPFVNPFNIWPFFRPPGTVLMSYPFGFSADPRGFFFRSVFFPAVLLGAAVLVVSYAPRAASRARWRCVGGAAFFSALPMFYHFEMNPLIPAPAIWGMVDAFLTGCAAFAMACAWRSLQVLSKTDRSIWCGLAGFVAGFCILVKPSGVVVACLLFALWIYLAVFKLILPERDAAQRRRISLELLVGASYIALPIVCVLEMALSSAYLSAADFAVGKANVAIMHAELRLTQREAWWLVHHNTGEALILWCCIIGLAVCRSDLRGPARPDIVAGFLAMLFGVWFWIFSTGGATEMRYGMPFLMMGAVLLMAHSESAWSVTPLVLQKIVTALFVIVPLNLGMLLLAPNPAIAWQKFSGVCVSAPDRTPALGALNALAAARRQSPGYLYSISVDYIYEIANAALTENRVLDPVNAVLVMKSPIDWLRPSTFRLDEILGATYILASAPPPPQQKVAVVNFADETIVMSQWARSLRPSDGVAVVYDGSDARILKVVDPQKLAANLRQLIARHKWRPTFVAANADFFK
jgi:hypothetical protein